MYVIPPGHRGNVRAGQLAGANIPELRLPTPMMQKMLEEQPSLTSMPSSRRPVAQLSVRSGAASPRSAGVPAGATSPARSATTMASARSPGRSPSVRSHFGGASTAGAISPRQEQSFASAYSRRTDLSGVTALDPVDPSPRAWRGWLSGAEGATLAEDESHGVIERSRLNWSSRRLQLSPRPPRGPCASWLDEQYDIHSTERFVSSLHFLIQKMF